MNLNSIDSINFLTLLQFLTYVQNLDYQTDSLGTTYYRKVNFRIQDFWNYKKESNNYYQLKKVLLFFEQLQKNSLVKIFSDTNYRSLVTIPEVNLRKDEQKFWVAEV